MALRRAPLALLACLSAGCGGGSSPASTAAPAPAPAPAPEGAPAPPASSPPVGPRAYARALDAYCGRTVRAVERLGDSAEVPDDPIAPVAAFAEDYRAALGRLGAVAPPAAYRRFHLLTLAQARESADRIDDGVRFGRQGDVDAATTALGELGGLLPSALPAGLERTARGCAVTLRVP